NGVGHRENSNVAYTSRRSAVYGTRRGAALGVTEPFSTGLGGDCFCLFYSAKEKKVHGLNGSGRAPAALTIDRLRREFGVAGDEIPAHSAHAATVPGAAAGWVDTLQLFGSGRIRQFVGDSGFPVGELTSPFWRDGAKLLTTASPNGSELLINGAGPLPGQVFRNTALASTMRLLAQDGARGFYEGPVASAIIDCLKESGCVMTLDDLCAHHSSTEEPISYEYRGHRLHECAPNCSGLAALLALDSRCAGKFSDSLRLAFADARRYVCDPDFSSIPVLQLLSPAYLAARAACFDPGSAAASVTHGTPLGGSDTGNACSFVNSTFHPFGTGIVPRGCGFALQDRGCLFSLDPAHPNCLEPRKRPYHTIIPAIVTTDGDLFMSYGIMGGFNQPQAHLQVLLNIDGRVAIEDGISQHTIDQLQRMGHSVYIVTGLQRSLFGRGQVIRQYTDQLLGIPPALNQV
ncbi:nucleophile aminohydrolase, partial [Kickxella alabastrina]|uniref:nucleophile aminohydrolase n=1 Tax=Kickxella alabastrina TaxID=61397 RepID=UPI00221FADDC